eukprot:6195784-Pleurochrysis_carterae.AAC.3
MPRRRQRPRVEEAVAEQLEQRHQRRPADERVSRVQRRVERAREAVASETREGAPAKLADHRNGEPQQRRAGEELHHHANQHEPAPRLPAVLAVRLGEALLRRIDVLKRAAQRVGRDVVELPPFVTLNRVVPLQHKGRPKGE